ncbi:scarecrow-like protein 9 [Sorghum bicolor]|uniref:Uncharacterized protein n=1 Tax=Sorghum bicolor TaxID=4558 RepID=A0A1Z5RK46_SORBI|nr:scarecrow-like protein 9 [Sorghum bicolor]OQU84113.1 hypothetical protein SORBI_3005G230300 [Sorghum bicolor]|eukprot:XP_002450069.1 scarecrow-like protein 9 [Sorghum bicolor]
MAAAPLPPDDLFLVHPDPPSPSVFLDLPPAPPNDDDDMVLPYISHLLMEEEDAHAESFFYQYPDHPALLHAQQPFADILADVSSASASATTSPSDDSDHSPTGNGRDANAADMATSAFLKGMQEATNLLPSVLSTNNSTLLLNHACKNSHAAARDDDGDPDPESRRAAKLMLPAEPADEADARRMFDQLMIHERDDICIKMKGVPQHQQQGQGVDDDNPTQRRRRLRRRRSTSTTSTDTVVDLHALLLRCAQAVATDDRAAAQDLLAHIRRHSSATGDAAQRMAHCFAEGLEARLAGTGSRLYRSLMLRRTSVADFLRAYRLYMAACCCKKVAFTFSNKTIHDAVAVAGGASSRRRRRLHIVDYGLGYGFQWPGLLRSLAVMEGGPPELVRITGIDLPQPGFRPARQIEDTGRRLSDCARQLGVPFAFRGIAAKREDVSPEDLHIDPAAEVLVVISLCHFRLLADEIDIISGAAVAGPGRRRRPSPRDEVLGNIRRMRPDVFIHGVVSGGYGTTYFPTRFREAMFYYSAQFDLLDATVPRDSPERLLLERDIFGRAAMNVVACEGTDRVERPETYRQWQVRNQRAGLRQLPLEPHVVKVVMDKVKDNYHRDFVVDEDQRWLLHRWKGRVLYGLSTWVAC